MLDSRKVAMWIATVLTTLYEVGQGSPEFTFYLAMGCNMADWQVVRDVMLRINVVTIKGHYVELTEHGRSKAVELVKLLPQPVTH